MTLLPPLTAFLESAHEAAPYEVAVLLDQCAVELGATSATAYLADLQQHALQPFTDGLPDRGLEQLSVDATLAGRAYQTSARQTQQLDDGTTRLWLPLLLGSDRVGVLAVDCPGEDEPAGLDQLADTAAGVLTSKAPYGDTLVVLRRVGPISLAAEIQYALLPPLSFTSNVVTVAAALEPCYNVAGDTVDYAVDAGLARFGVFDGMGHGLHSAQCASLTVAAYRNARRAGGGLVDSMRAIDGNLLESFGGEVFTTAVLAELDTRSGLLRWVNAGHPEPLLLRGGRMVRSLFVEPRPPLGLGHLADTADPEVGSEQLEPGDLVLVFTDGVVEARSPDGEFFGVERLTDLVLRHLAGGLPPAETMRRAVRELLDHQQGQLSDDATLLLVEWRRTA